MTTKPKLKFNDFNLDSHKVLYGEFVIGDYGYSIEEFLKLLTDEQIKQFQRRLAMERISD